VSVTVGLLETGRKHWEINVQCCWF